LIEAIPALANHGPMKSSDDQGNDDLREQYEAASVEKTSHYTADPSGQRTGNGPGPQFSDVFENVCRDAEAVLSADMVRARVAVNVEMLQEKISNIRGAVMMAYPMGLPRWDPIAIALENPGSDGLDGTPASVNLRDPDTATLWVASRHFDRNQSVGDRLGFNEKTKVVAKLEKAGAGPPAREPAVSEEERKAMMAHYFKRQEEMKKLAEANDDDYLASSWADPRAMKSSLQGLGSVKAPGLRR